MFCRFFFTTYEKMSNPTIKEKVSKIQIEIKFNKLSNY